VRFGKFALDVDTAELSNNGEKSTLSDKPFQLLMALLERPGQLVTREALKKRLWGSDTFVDFDLSLNKAVNRLREALQDSAEQPYFIETLPKRGYRFVAPVSSDEAEFAAKISEVPLPDTPAKPIPPRLSPRRWLIPASAFLILVAVAAFWQMGKRTPPSELRLKQLTWNSNEIPVRSAAISPDGNYLAYADRNGVHITALATNETRTMQQPGSMTERVDWWIISWFPDSTRIVLQTAPSEEVCLECVRFSTWVVSVLGGEPRKISDGVNVESLSPDGSSILFTSSLGEPGGREIGVMDASGEHARKLFETDQNSWLRYARWSPDGKRLAYMLVHDSPEKDWTLESRDLSGGSRTVLLSKANDVQHDFVWLRDGSLIYGADEPGGNACNYWRLQVDSRTGQPKSEPRKITRWAGFCMDSTSFTADGKHLVFTESVDQASIYVAQLSNRGRIATLKRLTLVDGWNWPIGWIAEDKSLIFVSMRERSSEIYRQALDSDVAEPLMTGIKDRLHPRRVTLNGEWLLYVDGSDNDRSTETRRLVRVPLSGGNPQEVLSGELRGVHCAKLRTDVCVMAEWSDDRRQVVFSLLDVLKGRGREVFKSNSSAVGHFGWEVSPDGKKILLIHVGAKTPIEVVSLADGGIHAVPISGWNVSANVTWASDGKGLYVASPTNGGCNLLYVDLNGKSKVVWSQRGGLSTIGMPSPDGRQLALTGWSLSSNVWLMENF
jgi:Tol biopolymer transport system component/DNA-binding winged helix-turn-helix (wHTH) protein